jgi:hypothetical protein
MNEAEAGSIRFSDEFESILSQSASIFEQGRKDEAISLCFSVHMSCSGRTQELYKTAVVCNERGFKEFSIEILNKIIEYAPLFLEARRYLMELLCEHEKWNSVISLGEDRNISVDDINQIETCLSRAGFASFMIACGHNVGNGQIRIGRKAALDAIIFHYKAENYMTVEAITRRIILASKPSDQIFLRLALICSAAALVQINCMEIATQRMERVILTCPQDNIILFFARITLKWSKETTYLFQCVYLTAALKTGSALHIMEAAEWLYHTGHQSEALALMKQNPLFPVDEKAPLAMQFKSNMIPTLIGVHFSAGGESTNSDKLYNLLDDLWERWTKNHHDLSPV